MIIKGPTVGTPMPRTDFNQENPAKADYLKGREKILELIAAAKSAGDKANTAAEAAQDAANNAHSAANGARTAADNAQAAADNAQTAAVNAKTAAVKESKEYTDSKHSTFAATITVNDWEGNAAPYTQTIGIEGILATDKPHICPVYASDAATRKAQRKAWAKVCEGEAGDGSITFICDESKPTVAIPLQIEVNR